MLIEVLFWVFFVLWIVAPYTPGLSRGQTILGAILFFLLGVKVFGNPMD